MTILYAALIIAATVLLLMIVLGWAASLSNLPGRQRLDDSPDVPGEDGYGRRQAEHDLAAWRERDRIRVRPKP